jgi:hypothetical protein
MKILIAVLALVFLSSQSFGQKKSKADPKDLQIDSLKQTVKVLSAQLDSVSKEMVKYVGLYDAIREKVLLYKFDPTRSTYLIDSLKAGRDSLSAMLTAKPKNTASADSLKMLMKENIFLKAKIDSVKTLYEQNKVAISQEEIERAKAFGSLKQLKELLDAKIITDAEFLSLKNKYLLKL